MDAVSLSYRAIGVIHSPLADPSGSPVQPSGARGVRGSAELLPELAPGLQDLEGFSHLIVIYHCHLSSEARLSITPFLDDRPRGVFATRAPSRPNPVGMSVLRLVGVRGNVLDLEDVDIIDGTPIIDIKPYVPEFDQPPGPVRTGWMADKAALAGRQKSDDRFRK